MGEAGGIKNDPDARLMAAFCRGDQRAFDQLIEKYYPRLYNYLLRMTGRRETADDLCQEVFLSVYQQADRYRPTALFRTWIYRIARNKALNEITRHQNRMLSFQSRPTDAENKTDPTDLIVFQEDTVRDKLDQEDKRRLVREAIEQLPPQQREAVILYRYEHMSYEEVAAVMGCSLGAVKQLLNRAKSNLFKILHNKQDELL